MRNSYRLVKDFEKYLKLLFCFPTRKRW